MVVLVFVIYYLIVWRGEKKNNPQLNLLSSVFSPSHELDVDENPVEDPEETCSILGFKCGAGQK